MYIIEMSAENLAWLKAKLEAEVAWRDGSGDPDNEDNLDMLENVLMDLDTAERIP